MAQKEQVPEANGPSVGARLKQVRLAKGISFDDAHEKTKIHPNILKAIEEDSLANVSPIYTKGFLKIYCRFLGVDPAEYIPDYREPKARTPYSPEISRARGSTGSAMQVFSSKVMALLRRVDLKKVLLAAVAVVALFLVFKLVKFIASRPRRASVPAAAKTAAPKPSARKTSTSVSSRAKTASSARQAGSAAAAKGTTSAVEKKEPVALPSPIRLTIRAKEDCFVQLKTDGHTVFQGAIKKNRFDSWEAKEKIEFSLSNAGAVELEVNGKAMTNIGRRRQAIKNILITKEGLSIL